MVKFHVTRGGKVWHKGVAQPVDAIIELDEKQLPHLQGVGYIDDSAAPVTEFRSVPNVETQTKTAEERYAEQTKSGVKK